MKLEETIHSIRPVDLSAAAEAQRALDRLTKPPGSLGRLEDVALRLCAIQGKIPPVIGRKLVFVFAADHGIAEERVSAFPQEVTAQMTYNFLAGKAAINVLARHGGVNLEIVDIGVAREFPRLKNLRRLKIRPGTGNFARGPAMTRAEARASIETGIRLVTESVGEKLFLIGAGDMGIGNTSSAAAILCALTGISPDDAVGRGTGIDDATWARKVAMVRAGIAANRPKADDPLDVLAKVGGLEIGAMAGVVLGAAAVRIPMVLDGFISGVAALLAYRLCPTVSHFLFASHLSAEKGHALVLEHLKLAPLLNLSMRLGEGTGACLGMGLMEAAAKLLREMATFDSAGVEDKLG